MFRGSGPHGGLRVVKVYGKPTCGAILQEPNNPNMMVLDSLDPWKLAIIRNSIWVGFLEFQSTCPLTGKSPQQR